MQKSNTGFTWWGVVISATVWGVAVGLGGIGGPLRRTRAEIRRAARKADLLAPHDNPDP